VETVSGAGPTEPFATLLALQEHDTATDRLQHRKQTLPERAELAALEARLAAVEARMAEAAGRRDQVGRRQAELERELAASEARIVQIEKRMYSGEVSAMRDLQAMAAEVESLRGRVSSLEDLALAAMDEREPLDAEVDGLGVERNELASQAEAMRRAIAEAEAALDAEILEEQRRRQALAARLPADLLATYDRLRARFGGVGVARLEHGSCMGCHLRLPAVELERLKRLPPDALVFCDQCGRILVR
jgi:predicted  nucleic acid-binding Zn-ribbon protein